MNVILLVALLVGTCLPGIYGYTNIYPPRGNSSVNEIASNFRHNINRPVVVKNPNAFGTALRKTDEVVQDTEDAAQNITGVGGKLPEITTRVGRQFFPFVYPAYYYPPTPAPPARVSLINL